MKHQLTPQESALGRKIYMEKSRTREQRTIELTRLGVSAKEIAEILGITRRSVQRIRQRTRITQCGPAELKMTPEIKTLAHNLLADGASKTDVARTIGVNPTAIYRHFRHIPSWTQTQINEWREMNNQLKQLAT